MGKFKLLLGTALLVVLSTVGYGAIVSAHSFRSGENVTVGSSRAINHSLFAAGNSVDISSEVFGDVFCAGQTVTVSGTVHGDVICAGQTVNVTGKVDGDVRLAGQSVNVGGNVKGNATVTGQTFTLGSRAAVDGDVTSSAAEATFNGPVGRDLAAGGNKVVIASLVGRDVKGEVKSLKLTDTARVKGNIDFTSNREADKAGGAVVNGKITRRDLPNKSEDRPKTAAIFAIGGFVYWFLAMLLLAMVLAFLLPRMLQVVTDRALPTPWRALLVGFVANLVMPIILLAVALTFIGLPLALLMGLAWLVLLLLSGPVAGYYLGRLILRNSRQPLLIMLVGAAVLLVLCAIPVIGFLVLLLAIWGGSGMTVLELSRRTPRPAYTMSETSATIAKKRR